MKKTLIAMTVACVSALTVLADSEAVSNDKPYDQLKFTTNAWFSLDATTTSGGSITAGSFGDNLSFDADTTPVTFTTTDACQQDFATVTLNVKASTVPNGSLKTTEAAYKIAVSLYESTANSATNFVAYLGSGNWVTLSSGAVPYEGDDYTLLVRFDNRAGGKKVSFAAVIGGVEYELKNGDEKWFAYTPEEIAQNPRHVGFLGKGALTSFNGIQLVVKAEVIIIEGGGTVDVKEEDVTAFEKDPEVVKLGGVDGYMAATATEVYKDKQFASGMKVAEAYALGLIKAGDSGAEVVNNGKVEVKAEATAVDTTTGDISVDFVGITPNAESGATITYQLQRSTDGTVWVDSTAPVATDASQIKIPATDVAAGYHFFKVVTTVTLKGAPAEVQE